MDERAIIAAYSRWAPVYDAVFGLQMLPGRRAVTRALNQLPPGRILEAGVGTGLSLPSYRSEHTVVGIDISREMLDRARARSARRRLPNIEQLAEMDAAALRFPDGSFDGIAAMFVMTVVPDPEGVMAEFARVLRPGGLLAVVGHFASEGGFSRWVEDRLSRSAARLGWHPDFPTARLTGNPDLRLTDTRRLQPLGLWSLLLFQRQ